MLNYDQVVYVQLCNVHLFLFNAESLSSLHKLSMSLLDTEEDLPVSGHEDQGVDGDVGGDVDDVLGGPVYGHRVSKVSGDIQFRRLALKSPPLGPKWDRWAKTWVRIRSSHTSRLQTGGSDAHPSFFAHLPNLGPSGGDFKASRRNCIFK